MELNAECRRDNRRRRPKLEPELVFEAGAESLAEFTKQDTQASLPGDSVWPFLGPLLALLGVPALIGWIFPESSAASAAQPANAVFDWRAFTTAGAQIVVVGAMLWRYRQHYLRVFPWSFSLWSIGWGVVGVVLWVALCEPQWESRLLGLLGLGGLLPERPAVNPFDSFSAQTVGWFLVLRFTVLALIVPLAEELFVRGWLVRYLEAQENWDVQSLAAVGWTAQLGVLAYAVMTHPQEAIAAIAWFSLVNWWMKRTGNFWDCVVVHAVTNGLLGAWILYSGQWRLW